MSIKATGPWVIVDPIIEETETSNIIIPDTVKESMDEGKQSDFATVIALGTEAQEEGKLKVGDKVALLMGSCLRIPEVDGKNYLCTRHDRIVCVVG